MKLCRRLIPFIAFLLIGASGPLQPTVKLKPSPSGPVPADCYDSAAPVTAVPRIAVSDIPLPEPTSAVAVSQAPPSAHLRTLLRETYAAAARNDYETFKSSNAQLRAAIDRHPRGGERSEAEAAARVFDDVEALWDHQFQSATGAFFDESTADGALLRRARAYPTYGSAIARDTLVTGGTTLYPTRETREFVVERARERVGAPRIARAATTTPPRPRRISTGTTASVTRTPTPARKRMAARSTSTPVVKPSRTRRAVATPTAASPAPIAAPVTAAAPPPPAPTPVPTAAPAPTEPVAPPSPTTTTAVAETAPTTTTIAETTAAPATPAEPTPTPAPERRSVILPLILIIIGIGVLIVLFRASSG